MVYGHPALIAAIGLLLTTRVSPASSSPDDGGSAGVEIRVPGLGWDVLRTGWPEIVSYTERVRERWRQYAHSPRAGAFDEVRGTDPAHLLKVALGEAALYARERGAGEPPALSIEVESDIPVGSGFGSSAALAATVIAGSLAACGIELPTPDLERLTLEAERRQHGIPSGVDGATVIHGGLVWAERPSDGAPLELTPLDLASPHLARFRVFDTGTPVESTGAVVAAVRERVAAEPERLRPVLAQMGETARAFRAEIAGDEDRPQGVMGLIRRYQRDLETLGVIPAAARELVRQVEARGGAAKISGAGALSPAGAERPGAGSLLVYHPQPEQIGEMRFLDPFPCHAVPLGVSGFRVESDQP